MVSRWDIVGTSSGPQWRLGDASVVGPQTNDVEASGDVVVIAVRPHCNIDETLDEPHGTTVYLTSEGIFVSDG